MLVLLLLLMMMLGSAGGVGGGGFFLSFFFFHDGGFLPMFFFWFHMNAWGLGGGKKGISSFGTRITDACELGACECGCWGPHLGPLARCP